MLDKSLIQCLSFITKINKLNITIPIDNKLIK